MDVIPPKHSVYIIEWRDGTLSTGYIKNVAQRPAAHNAGKGGHSTPSHRPVTLLATWAFATKSEALRAEWQIKRFSRAQKLCLIDGKGTEAR